MKQLVVVICFLGGLTTWGQQNLVINGGFETIDLNVSPTPINHWAIEWAPPWKSLYGTCDISHPNAPFNMSMIANTGQGCMRLSHLYEYALGRTVALTAGTTYEVSFAVKRDNSCNAYNRTIGLQITPDAPNPAVSFNKDESFRPQVEIPISSGNYVSATYCFVAETSGVHYIIIGGTCIDTPGDEYNTLCYAVDDVTVFEKTDFSDLPVANISSPQTNFCLTDNVILDGSSSSNENRHKWKIHGIPGGKARLCEIYNSGWVNGPAGTLNVTDVIPQPLNSVCLRAYLYVDNGCQARDSFDFCFVKPEPFFVYNGQPVCEGTVVDLSVTGDNGWTYTWSDANGQLASGAGLKTLQVAPQTGNASYTVTVTTPEGCTETKTYTFVVHSQNNLPPWMNGINGTNEYTYFVTAGDLASFTSNIFNDNANEQIAYTVINNIPASIPSNITNSSGNVQFTMQTYLSTATGTYDFIIIADDQNSCGPGIDTFKFTIVVLCHHCPVCISYEDRSPSGTPLPMKTAAGKCITAGLSQEVSTGSDIVYFIAGQSITLGPNFEAGVGFEAVIDPLTCTVNCNDCCDDWTGFRLDEQPALHINPYDNDPTNDFIQWTDINNPFCAFNAYGFELHILPRWGTTPIHSDMMLANYCCYLKSPAPENPIPHSSIWWDGKHFDNGERVRVADGTYQYRLKIFGCNGEVLDKHGYIHVDGITWGMAQNNEGTATSDLQSLSEDQQQLEVYFRERELLEEAIAISPNPTTGIVRITGADEMEIEYQIFDDKGIMLTRKEKPTGREFSMESYVSGTYYVRVYANNTYVVRKLIKL